MEDFLNKLQTMDPVLHREVFESSDFLYQVKWDGVRMLAAVSGKNVSLRNRKGNQRTAQYPELNTLPQLINSDSAVLDGEIIVFQDGKPSISCVMQRDLAKSPLTISRLTKTNPIAYMVFDLLYCDGKDLRQEILTNRIARLQELFENREYLFQVESFAEGKKLFEAVDDSGLEGIVAKRKNSFYLPGKNHRDWYKTKCLKTQNCLVVGYTLKGNAINALLLAVIKEGEFIYAGKAANGLSSEQLNTLSKELPKLKTGKSPFHDKTQQGHYYVEPHLAVLVEFLEWTDQFHLRFPVIKQFINADENDFTIH